MQGRGIALITKDVDSRTVDLQKNYMDSTKVPSPTKDTPFL